MQSTASHKYYLDFLRIFAILCIIYNHTNSRGYFLYADTINPVYKFLSMMLGCLISVGVPIFFMISGALLLQKEESFTTLFRNRVVRILLVLFLFSILQYLFRANLYHDTLSVSSFIKEFLTADIIPSYWFLYAYLIYLLILPFLRKLVLLLQPRDMIYLLILFILSEGVLPLCLLSTNITLTPYLNIPLVNQIIFYPLFGYCIDQMPLSKLQNKKYLGASRLAAIGSLLIMSGVSYARNLPAKSFTTFDHGLLTGAFSGICAICIFYWAKLHITSIAPQSIHAKVILALSSCTFGVYLLESLIRIPTRSFEISLAKSIGDFPACLLWVCFIFLITSAITFLLKCIPGIKKLL